MRRYLLSFIVVFGVFVLATLAGSFCSLSAYAAGRDVYAAWDTLAQAFHEVQARYVEEKDATSLVYAALGGVVQALDPHSAFLDPESYRELQEQEQDRYFGIGVRVAPDPAGLRVVEVLPDSPSRHHDLQVGDLIVEIDGAALAGEEFELAAQRISGPRGQVVSLQVLRGEQQLGFELARDLVHVPAVWSELVAPGRAYLALVHFQEGSGDQFQAALRELEQQNGAPLQELVLDLRDNPGGLLDEAIQVVDTFVGDVPIVATRGRDANNDDQYRGSPDPQDLDLSPVVLINGGSASASEIVAGALDAHQRATLVGTPSYGKGSVQAIWAFEDGSALKLTISRYYLPDDRPIDHREGLQPAILVRAPQEQAQLDLLDALQRQVEGAATLRSVDQARLLHTLQQVETSLPDPEPRRSWDLPVAERRLRDPQLAAALAVFEQEAPAP